MSAPITEPPDSAELRASRELSARLGASAERERRRIERDLHDGAQQRLVALRFSLGVVRDIVASDPVRAAELLLQLDADVEETLEELRGLARGLCPPVLADRGLGDALRSAGRIGPLPVSVSVQGLRRYAPAVESAIYFVVLEALQNAAKHAVGATRVAVTIVDDGMLRFTVADDGLGFRESEVQAGDGLANMRDRVLACGGALEVRSGRGRGTEVTGTIPLPAEAG